MYTHTHTHTHTHMSSLNTNGGMCVLIRDNPPRPLVPIPNKPKP